MLNHPVNFIVIGYEIRLGGGGACRGVRKRDDFISLIVNTNSTTKTTGKRNRFLRSVSSPKECVSVYHKYQAPWSQYVDGLAHLAESLNQNKVRTVIDNKIQSSAKTNTSQEAGKIRFQSHRITILVCSNFNVNGYDIPVYRELATRIVNVGLQVTKKI